MKHILLSLGLLALICFGLRMFGIGEAIITTDKQWLMLLFVGLLLTMIGFLVESNQIKPINSYQQHNRGVRIRSCWYGISAIAIVISVILFK